MQQLTNIQAIETALSQYGDIVISKNKKDKAMVMSMEEYRKKLFEEQIEKKILKAEKQIEEGKTVKASEVFKELEAQYGF